ncbi:phage integrase N-terminal SAM-like domain-containing protein [Rheinheimera pacifica]|uniref:phage integrase N-terminal SAM-like domain-containing protein n=1 Tax=Rheinheimera pacifica TaxID=173990 RepID=UPI0032C21C15
MTESSPFMQFIAEEMYTRRYAKRTVETYLHWIKFFILFHKKQHPKDLLETHVEQFLTHLAVTRNVAVQTQALALNALSFMYKEILKRPFALARKYPTAPKELGWQYLFPSSRLSVDPPSY